MPEREYVVPHENMVDVTQSMACIQCGACVSDCLSMEVDPLFIGPAALAKAYRFVGDPRDAETAERLQDLADDPHGIYDCTHCFKCIDACPKGVAPMSQIMRLRRRAGNDFHITDPNNGERHERAFVSLVKQYGLLNEAELLPRSYGGDSPLAKFKPAAAKELSSSLPAIAKALLRRKVTPKTALAPHKLREVRPPCDQGHLRHGRGPRRARRAQPLHLRPRRGSVAMKVAYWPGCVSRGFTPELHGSMAKIAPLLDIELVEIDRGSCCGAGVIAEHSQELADTLNARTFALAQQAEGTALMMNICSTCQGAQSECQERLDANAEYRAHVNETLAGGGPVVREGPVEQEPAVAARRGDRPRGAALARRRDR